MSQTPIVRIQFTAIHWWCPNIAFRVSSLFGFHSFIHSFVCFKGRISCRKQCFYIGVIAYHIIGSINFCCVMTSTAVASLFCTQSYCRWIIDKIYRKLISYYIGFQSFFPRLLFAVLLCTSHILLQCAHVTSLSRSLFISAFCSLLFAHFWSPIYGHR